jgi:glycolate oxidase
MFFRPKPLKLLQRALGRHKVLTSPEDLLTYSYDVSLERSIPEVVILAESTEDVVTAVEFALDEGYHVTPRGAGTGMVGGAVPVRKGMVLSTERMNQILEINQERKYVIVEPGVPTALVQEEVAKVGLFYPPDPSSYKVSTIGGNVAVNSGGLRCVKYGTTKQYVLGLEFVTARGELCATGALSRNSTPVNLTPLLIGSEGTLGVITQIALKLIDAPEARGTLRVVFPSLETAGHACAEIMAIGVLPSVCELMDKAVLEAVTAYTGTKLPDDTDAMLLIEVDGSPEEVQHKMDQVQGICRKRQALEILYTDVPADAEKLWTLRRSISPSLARISSGKLNEDISVPRSKLPELLSQARQISRRYNLLMPCFGHAGDGNIHVNIMFDPDDDLQKQRALIAVEDVFKEAIRLGGTISGEHGIGLVKKDFLRLQMNSVELETLRKIKNAFDPEGIFNPGKVIPD